MSNHQTHIDQATTSLLQAKSRLVSIIDAIPDDYLHYSPSESARTPIQIVVHCASAIRYIHQQMKGQAFEYPTTAQADLAFRLDEQAALAKDDALDYLDREVTNYIEFLDTLSEEDLQTTKALPFGLGMLPLQDWLGAAAGHTQGHIAQLEYIQTIYGDHDWRLG